MNVANTLDVARPGEAGENSRDSEVSRDIEWNRERGRQRRERLVRLVRAVHKLCHHKENKYGRREACSGEKPAC